MKIPPFLLNKYAIASGIFVIWLLLFHNVDVFYMWNLRAELRELKSQCELYKEKNMEAHEALQDLNNNMRSLEKFAREHYFMKKENEDLFVIYEDE